MLRAVVDNLVTPLIAAIFGKLAERRARGADPATKQRPEGLSEIPHGARKRAFCGIEQHDAAPA